MAGSLEHETRSAREQANFLAEETRIIQDQLHERAERIREANLLQARRHVAEAERHLVRQRELVAELERDGHDTSKSKQLLHQFGQIYELHVANRDRLEKELDEASK